MIRALSALSQHRREAIADTEASCRRAIDIAPAYGQAHSLLAWVLQFRTIWSGDMRMVASEASAEAQIALSIDDRDAWAHLVQGNVLHRSRRFSDAARALHRALQLNPNFALAHAMLSLVLSHQGTHQEAIESAELALRLSPNDRTACIFALLALMHVHLLAGRYDECATWARTMTEKVPGHIGGHMWLTAALAMAGNLTAAAEARDAVLRLRPDFSLAWMIGNFPFTGPTAERLLEGLRKAGAPET